MGELPAPIRLPGEPERPREPYERPHRPAPPAVADDDFDPFGAEAARGRAERPPRARATEDEGLPRDAARVARGLAVFPRGSPSLCR